LSSKIEILFVFIFGLLIFIFKSLSFWEF